MARKASARDTSIETYRAKRDFAITVEPRPANAPPAPAAMFVVQKHAAHRAGLHWDFRLEHGGVLWSWAVREGPSLDPADRRVAVHVEDHPVGYADFQGTIPAGQYGGGRVETWDRGTWQALDDPEKGMRKGNLRFVLSGTRLHGRFTLARLNQRDPKKQEAWFLIKGHDEHAREGIDAPTLEREVPYTGSVKPAGPADARVATRRSAVRRTAPAKGAVRRPMPDEQEPQLCAIAQKPPEGEEWLSEIKFDGYRILAAVENGRVRLLTRNGHDWAERMPSLARAVVQLPVRSAMVDGELVNLRRDGVSSFPGLQAALKAGRDDMLVFQAFDLLHVDGWDLRPCSLLERKRVLQGLTEWTDVLRYSDHHQGDTYALWEAAGRMGLEGIICKQANAPYQGGRGRSWLKVKIGSREELVVLGWTPPGGSRVGIGALHVGYFDPQGGLHYAGGVGSGFDHKQLVALRDRLDGMQASPPPGMLVSGDPIDAGVTWVRPELVVQIKYAGWSGAGRLRHAVFLGQREDKAARDVVRDVADPDADREEFKSAGSRAAAAGRKGWHGAVPPLPRHIPPATPSPSGSNLVIVQPLNRTAVTIAGVRVTHPDRQLWPGITKQALAEYWLAVAGTALPGIALRPLSILRCPGGIEGKERFYQKNGHGVMPGDVRQGMVSGQPFLAIDGVAGLVSMAQMSAIELHAWGSAETDRLKPDRLVFDLDPGEGVLWAEVVKAAHDVRKRLSRLGLVSFCRTTGGKGLHVVVPIVPEVGWDVAKPFCRAFAETMAKEESRRFLAHLKIADRRGRILVDWLRNGLGATAVASFSPRARPGATVATPLAWREVVAGLDPSSFTVGTVPARLARLKADPWRGFDRADQHLPDLPR